MSHPASAQFLVLCAVLFVLSVALAGWLRRTNVLDVPNDRSSHDRPIPRIGGVAVVTAYMLGLAALYAFDGAAFDGASYLIVFVAASLGIAAVGLLDDLGRLSAAKTKFAAQFAAAVVLVLAGVSFRSVSIPVLGPVDLGVWGGVLTVFWLVALTNSVNFMDGLNGLAGGTALVAAIFLGAVTLGQGASLVPLLSFVLVPAILGFLVFNFPRASLFMGDVGSQFIGFVFAALAVVAAEHDAVRTSLLVVPLLYFHFIFDTFFTFMRRLFAGENVTRAHRSHLYQLLNRSGYGHVAVSGLHIGMTVLQGIGALVMVRLDADSRLLVFLPFLALETVYAVVVMRMALRRGLLGG